MKIRPSHCKRLDLREAFPSPVADAKIVFFNQHFCAEYIDIQIKCRLWNSVFFSQNRFNLAYESHKRKAREPLTPVGRAESLESFRSEFTAKL